MNTKNQVSSMSTNEWNQIVVNIWDLYFMHHPMSPMSIDIEYYQDDRVELTRQVMLYLCEVK